MKVTVLSQRSAPAAIWQRGQTAPHVIRRRQMPYWQERKWWFDGDGYSGSYQTKYGSFLGWVRLRAGQYEFFIFDPPEEMRAHSHWSCFQEQPQSPRWFLVHMAERPKDASSGILAIEALLTDAFRGAGDQS